MPRVLIMVTVTVFLRTFRPHHGRLLSQNEKREGEYQDPISASLAGRELPSILQGVPGPQMETARSWCSERWAIDKREHSTDKKHPETLSALSAFPPLEGLASRVERAGGWRSGATSCSCRSGLSAWFSLLTSKCKRNTHTHTFKKIKQHREMPRKFSSSSRSPPHRF